MSVCETLCVTVCECFRAVKEERVQVLIASPRRCPLSFPRVPSLPLADALLPACVSHGCLSRHYTAVTSAVASLAVISPTQIYVNLKQICSALHWVELFLSRGTVSHLKVSEKRYCVDTE